MKIIILILLIIAGCTSTYQMYPSQGYKANPRWYKAGATQEDLNLTVYQ